MRLRRRGTGEIHLISCLRRQLKGKPRERRPGVLDDHKGGGAVTLIADDPTVRCMERTGYPPWMVYGGKNDEEEQETEHE